MHTLRQEQGTEIQEENVMYRLLAVFDHSLQKLSVLVRVLYEKLYKEEVIFNSRKQNKKNCSRKEI